MKGVPLAIGTIAVGLVAQTQAAADQHHIDLWPEAGEEYGHPVAEIVLLQDQVFANSYRSPVTAQYTPPSVDFNRAVLTLSINSTGYNYDRLGQLFFEDVEVWRTSTSEPNRDDGRWFASKDVSHFLPLFQKPSAFRMIIDNVLEGNLDGVFAATVSIKLYNSSAIPQVDDAWPFSLDKPPSDIHALSSTPQNTHAFFAEADQQVSGTIGPFNRSVNRVLLQIYASGNADEEFWWHPTGEISPTRFIDCYINQQLAGFAVPFPTFFTGALNPTLWSPLVGIRTYDLPAYYVDVTPFLNSLWDREARLEFNVTTGFDSSPVPSNWIMNVNVFTWSTPGQNNTGLPMVGVFAEDPQGSPQGTSMKEYIPRRIKTMASLVIGGEHTIVSWSQEAEVSVNSLDADSNSILQHISTGQNTAVVPGIADSKIFHFSYPLTVTTGNNYTRVQETYEIGGAVRLSTWIDTQSKNEGGVVSSNSTQYLQYAKGAHLVATKDGMVTTKW